MIYRGSLWTSEVWDAGRITICVQSCRCSGNAPRGHKQPCSTRVCVPFFPWLAVKDFFWQHQAPVISAFYQECYRQSGIQVTMFTKPRYLNKDTATLWWVKGTSTHLKSYILLSGLVCSAALSQIFLIGSTECLLHEVPFPSMSASTDWPRCHWNPTMTSWQSLKSESHWSQALWSLSWSSFPLFFSLESIGVLALTWLSISTANINNKCAHNTCHRGLLMWHSAVNSFYCLPP